MLTLQQVCLVEDCQVLSPLGHSEQQYAHEVLLWYQTSTTAKKHTASHDTEVN